MKIPITIYVSQCEQCQKVSAGLINALMRRMKLHVLPLKQVSGMKAARCRTGCTQKVRTPNQHHIAQ